MPSPQCPLWLVLFLWELLNFCPSAWSQNSWPDGNWTQEQLVVSNCVQWGVRLSAQQTAVQTLSAVGLSGTGGCSLLFLMRLHVLLSCSDFTEVLGFFLSHRRQNGLIFTTVWTQHVYCLKCVSCFRHFHRFVVCFFKIRGEKDSTVSQWKQEKHKACMYTTHDMSLRRGRKLVSSAW